MEHGFHQNWELLNLKLKLCPRYLDKKFEKKMCKFKFAFLIYFGILCFREGHGFTISTELMNNKLIFRWSNTLKQRNDIMVYTDGQPTNWIQTMDDQYTVENVMSHTTVRIKVLEFIGLKNKEYMKTYAHKVNTVESTEGESKNISWTAEYFPNSGDYKIFHAYVGPPLIIIKVTKTTYNTNFAKKYFYHAKPGSLEVLFEVRNISVEDAGYYVGSESETKAFSSAKGIVLVVSGKPEKPKITGDLEIKDGRNATLKCESKSTSAPDYHKFPPLLYTWFVNGIRIGGEQSANYTFKVFKDDKYKWYSCQAKETLESERSGEIRINILYGPKSVRISPNPLHDTLTIKDGAPLGLYNCSADCNPPCTVQWQYKRPDGDLKNVTPYGNSPLPLPDLNADRTRMTLIRCEANNSEGRKNDGIKLNILSCNPGSYGKDCKEVCGYCEGNEPCNHINGSCPGSCEPGYAGEMCLTKCRSGSYGKNCNSTCGHCAHNATCDPITGACPDCAPGWTDSGENKCNRACKDGWYGRECKHRCGYCRDDEPCHHVTGSCSGFCEPGYLGEKCDESEFSQLLAIQRKMLNSVRELLSFKRRKVGLIANITSPTDLK